MRSSSRTSDTGQSPFSPLTSFRTALERLEFSKSYYPLRRRCLQTAK
jgi:hypothetical protein